LKNNIEVFCFASHFLIYNPIIDNNNNNNDNIKMKNKKYDIFRII